MTDIDAAFTRAVMQAHIEAKTRLHYNATYWLQMVQEHGAVEAAKQLITGAGVDRMG